MSLRLYHLGILPVFNASLRVDTQYLMNEQMDELEFKSGLLILNFSNTPFRKMYLTVYVCLCFPPKVLSQCDLHCSGFVTYHNKFQ